MEALRTGALCHVFYLVPKQLWKHRVRASADQDVPSKTTACTEAPAELQRAGSVSKKHTFVVSVSEDLELFLIAA